MLRQDTCVLGDLEVEAVSPLGGLSTSSWGWTWEGQRRRGHKEAEEDAGATKGGCPGKHDPEHPAGLRAVGFWRLDHPPRLLILWNGCQPGLPGPREAAAIPPPIRVVFLLYICLFLVETLYLFI